LDVNVTSYDLNLDGIILRYGSTCGFTAKNLIAPFHAFLLNAGETDIKWKTICRKFNLAFINTFL